MVNSKRIAYVDMARGIGMLLVVMGHVEYISAPIRQYITSFHMPLFFLISGFLILEKADMNKKFIELAKRKARSLLVPYAVFSVLSFVIEGSRLLIKDLDGWSGLFRQLYQSLCFQGVSTLWFLPALFIGEVLFIWIRKHCSHIWTVVLVAFTVVAVYFLNNAEQTMYQLHSESLKWSMLHDVLSMLLRNIFCVGLVAVGYYAGKLIKYYAGRSLLDSGIGILLLILTGVIVRVNGGVDLRAMQLGNLLFYLLGAVCGSLGILLLCRDIERSPILPVSRICEYYGRNSLIVMATHIDFRVLYCSIMLAGAVNSFLNNNILFCTLIVVFVFVIEIFVIEFFNHFLAFVLEKRVKNS